MVHRSRLVIAVLSLVSLLGVMAFLLRTGEQGTTSEPSVAGECSGVSVEPGDDVRQRIHASPDGATLCFSPGVYRLGAPLTPKARQRLRARPGAVLNGSVIIPRWRRVDSFWLATGYLPADPRPHGECTPGFIGCRYSETVFLDGRSLHRVDRQDQLRGGRFFEDYLSNEIWIADDPTKHLLEVARASAAIQGSAPGVVLEGFVIEKFANPAQTGAVEPRGRDWMIQDNDIRLNHGHGIQVAADRVTMRGNHVHHNGQLGIGSGAVKDQLLEGNEIDHNNTAGFSFRWEAGGAKWAMTEHLVVRGNCVHDNGGAGLWTDTNNVDTTYEGNAVTGNAGSGILHETSFQAVIHGNQVSGNGNTDPTGGWGPSGIQVASSPGVEIDHNTVTGNANGIVLAQQVRKDSPSPLGRHELRDISVHDNTVTMTRGVTGMVNDTGNSRYYSSSIRFQDNTYFVPDTSAQIFAWMNATWNQADWRFRFRQDVTSPFLPLDPNPLLPSGPGQQVEYACPA